MRYLAILRYVICCGSSFDKQTDAAYAASVPRVRKGFACARLSFVRLSIRSYRYAVSPLCRILYAIA